VWGGELAAGGCGECVWGRDGVRGFGGHCACGRQRGGVHLLRGRQWGRRGWGGRCDGQRGESVGVPGGGALLRKSDGWGRRRRGRRHVPAVTKRDRNWPIRRNSIFAQAQGACACLLDFTWSWRARACTPAQFAPFPAGTTTWGLCCKLE